MAMAGPGQTGPVKFFVPHNEPKNGHIMFDAKAAAARKGGDLYDVRVGQLAAADFKRVDFIKIDVEGAEMLVVDSLRDLIERHDPRMIVEINFGRGYSYDDVARRLGRNGQLQHLDFDARVRPLTRDMAASERVNQDWLVYRSAAR
jgi:hypothetical protein